jgi:hypothetical protein
MLNDLRHSAQGGPRRMRTTLVTQVTTYNQSFPKIGLVASETKALGAQVLNSVVNTYTATPLGGTRNFVGLTGSVASSWDLDGTAAPAVTTSYAYDAYGNATQISVSTPDGASKVTTNTYTNNATNWFLGRLTAASVTSIVPDMSSGGGGANNAPIANDDDISVAYNGSTTFDPRANDSDPDGDLLTIASNTSAAHGAVQILSGGTQLKYTAAGGYGGPDSFAYTINDGQGHTATASVAVSVASNQPPVAVSNSISVAYGSSVTFDPRTNDSDPEGDPLTITASTNGAHGTVQILSGAQLTYTATGGYSGADSFTYTISDGQGHTATATVSVSVAANQAPTAVNDSVTVARGQSVIFDPRTNDNDPEGDPLTFVATTNPAKGNVKILNSIGNVATIPSLGTQIRYTAGTTTAAIGTFTFTYTISDGHGHTAVATVTVTVTGSVWPL